MANFSAEIPNELLTQFQELDMGATDMMKKMTRAGALVVFNNVKSNLSKSFDNKSGDLANSLIITRSYKNSKEEIATKVGFYGYDSHKSKKYPNGVPNPLKALAREYGTSRGEVKRPFLRPAFKKNEIESAMLSVQDECLQRSKYE